MFGFRKSRPPLTTAQRVDIELLMRKTIETVGASFVRQANIVTELSELNLDGSSANQLLLSASREVQRRMPMITAQAEIRGQCEIVTTDGDQLGYPSTYQPRSDETPAKISVAEDTLADPLRTVMELSYQYSNHFWLTNPNPTPLDTNPRTTNLLPVCCGLGVLASDASFNDQQWSQAGWTGWSMSRSGYYTAIEIGYAMALLARFRGESNPQWTQSLRLDSRDTAQKAWRYFARHEQAGGQLLFDASKVPASSCDMGELATWLRGPDHAFALAAGYALMKLDDLSPLVIDAAIAATGSGDGDLTPVATRLLGGSRQSDAETEARIRELIRNDSPQTALAAIRSASALGMPLADYGAKITKLLDVFAEDSFVLLDVIGVQGRAFEFMAPKICEQIERSIREIDDQLTSALLECLRRITADPQHCIEKRIKSPEIRREALERLAVTQ